MKGNRKLKFNFIILDRNIENKFMKFLKKNGYDKYFLFYAKGSANSALLEYLGIGESEKEVIVIPSNESDSIKLFLREKCRESGCGPWLHHPRS